MTITNYGYTGTVDNVQWAKMAQFLGSEYAVGGGTDYLVQAVAGQDRTVRILPGWAMGHGVLSINDATLTMQLNTIASGTRWDLVVIRRNWATGGATTGTIVQGVTGTSAKAIPTGRADNPGVQDDQMLALVQVTAGQSMPTAIVDLRVRSSKVLTVDDLLAIPATDAPLGTYAAVGTTLYRRGLNSGGTEAWLTMGGHATGPIGYLTDYSQMPAPYASDTPRYRETPLDVNLGGMIYRSGATFARAAENPFDVTPALPASIRPGGSRHLGLVNTFLGPGRLHYNSSSGRLEVQYPTAQTMTSQVWWVSFNGVTWTKE